MELYGRMIHLIPLNFVMHFSCPVHHCTDPVFKNLLTNCSQDGLFWGLAMFAIQIKMFLKLCRSKWNWFCFDPNQNHLNQLFTLYFLFWAILKYFTYYKQCFVVTLVNINDALIVLYVQWHILAHVDTNWTLLLSAFGTIDRRV